MTGYLSCQIFLMTFVNWPDKDLRPVADSVSFGADKIGSDLQRNRKKSVPNWSASVWPDADIWTRSLTEKHFTIHLVIAGKPSSVISIFTWCEGFPWNISFYHGLFPKILLHQLIKKYIYLAALTFLLQLQDAQYRKSAITLSIICRSLNDT